MSKSLMRVSKVVLTIDTDWAPDFAIDYVREALEHRSIKATWFVTHESSAIGRLRENTDLFEMGIHPNFLRGSSQGDNYREVIESCISIVPEARAMRTHCLYWSSKLLDEVLEWTDVNIDASTFLPNAANADPMVIERPRRKIVRIPHVWQDDYELERSGPVTTLEELLSRPGLQVIDLHPIHIFLNTQDLNREYFALKRSLDRSLANVSLEDLQLYMRDGEGIRSFFQSVIDFLGAEGKSQTMREIADQVMATEELSSLNIGG